jgi:hypothetical protein
LALKREIGQGAILSGMKIERLWIDGELVDPESELFKDIQSACDLEIAAHLHRWAQRQLNGNRRPGDPEPIGLIRSS